MEINVIKILHDIIKHKRLYFYILPLVVIISIIYVLSLPNQYTCSIELAPEIGGNKMIGGSSFDMKFWGITLKTQNKEDAIYPVIYPELMQSVDFRLRLLNVEIKRDGDDKPLKYYDYLLNYQKKPWWETIFGEREYREYGTPNSFKLTERQYLLADAINGRVKCKVDKRSSVISIDVRDQDPRVSAIIADSASVLLQKFIVNYHTNKAKQEASYYHKITKENKIKYDSLNNVYSQFRDANREISTQNLVTKEMDLRKEKEIQYHYFSEFYSKYLEAELKAQKEVPAFVVLKSASIPSTQSGPNRTMTIFQNICIVLGIITLYVMYKEDDLRQFVDIK